MTGLSVDRSLIEDFDGIVCDLDGVVYRGHDEVPHAVASLLSALSAGVGVVYATNNASRAPATSRPTSALWVCPVPRRGWLPALRRGPAM